MIENLFEKLQSPSGIEDFFHEDVLTRLRQDPTIIERIIQLRHQDAIDALADISRLTQLLAKTQADYFCNQKKEHLKNKELSFLHTSVELQHGFSWTANWRYGGYGIDRKGKAFPSTKRLKVNADGNYSTTIFNNAKDWEQWLGKDTEANYALLRAMNQAQRKIRDAIYRSSDATRKFFNEQPSIYGYDDVDRAPVIDSSTAQQRFKDRFDL